MVWLDPTGATAVFCVTETCTELAATAVSKSSTLVLALFEGRATGLVAKCCRKSCFRAAVSVLLLGIAALSAWGGPAEEAAAAAGCAVNRSSTLVTKAAGAGLLLLLFCCLVTTSVDDFAATTAVAVGLACLAWLV